MRAGFADSRAVEASAAGDTTRAAGDTASVARCTPWTGSWTFSPPEAVAEINSSADDLEPYLTRDELTIFFSSNRAGGAGGFDVYFATRPSRTAPFADLRPHTGINTAGDDTRLAVAPDGSTAYLATSGRSGPGRSDLWVTADNSPAPASLLWSPLLNLNTADDEWDPFPTADGLALYLIRAHGSAWSRLLVTKRGSTEETFGTPVLVDGADTASHEGNPTLSADELVFVFNSTRAGGQGKDDLWFMTRGEPKAAFSAPQPVPVVNSESYESESFLSADGCTLYFASDRPGGKGGRDIYRSRFLRQP